MSRIGNQPLLVLSDESQRTTGRDAQSMNITAGKAVASAVRTTLGPKGMDKMLVDSGGNVVVTNDGVTILKEMDIEHPAANMIVDVAETQEAEVGDGTTSAVVVAGELLSKAEDLLEQDIHPTTLVQGYRRAAHKATEILEENAIDVDPEDTEFLEQLAQTAMTGKGAEGSKEHLAQIVVQAVQSVADEHGVDVDHIDIQDTVGGSIEDTELIEGLVISKTPSHENMPLLLEDANIAVLNSPIEIPETEIDAEVNVSDPDQLQEFLDQEEAQLREMVDHLEELGVDAVFTRKGIDDLAQHFLAEKGMMGVRRVRESQADQLCRATGATRVNDIFELSEDHLGYAGELVQRDVAGSDKLFVQDVKDPKSVSIILRGGTQHVVDEIERAIEDSIGVVRTVLDDGKVVPGGGAPEVTLSLALRDYADSVGGREQLAVEAFADAVDVIPRTLAENAGHDPIDSLVELRSRHDGGESDAGLEAYTGEVINMEDEGVLEPLRVKTQAIDAATESAVMILRIDDVISAGDLAEDRDAGDDEDMPDMGGGMGGMGGGMGGMGGMGGGMGGMM